MKKYYALILILAVLNCSRVSNSSNNIDQLKQVSVVQNSYCLNLDNETAFTSGPLVPLDESSTKLVLFNGVARNVKIFDTKTKGTIETIDIPEAGPKEILAPIYMSAFNDQIFIQDFYKKQLSSLISDSTFVSYKTMNDEYPKSSQLSNSLAPILLTDSHIFISTHGQIQKDQSNFHEGNALTIVDRSDSSILNVLDFPQIYLENFVAGGKVSMASITHNPHTGKVVVSFPLEDNLFEVSSEGEVNEIITNYKLDGLNEIPFKSSSSVAKASIEEIQKRYVENSSYSIIHYDPFDSLYYRFVALPVNSSLEDAALDRDSGYRNYDVLVFDFKFNLVASGVEISTIDLGFGSAKYFSTPEGFFVFSNTQSDENQMCFDKIAIGN